MFQRNYFDLSLNFFLIIFDIIYLNSHEVFIKIKTSSTKTSKIKKNINQKKNHG